MLQEMLSGPSLHPGQQQKQPHVQKQNRNKNSHFTGTCYTNNEGWQTPRWESLRASAADERAHTRWLLTTHRYHSKSPQQTMGLICIISSRSKFFLVAFLHPLAHSLLGRCGRAKAMSVQGVLRLVNRNVFRNSYPCL